MWLSVHTATESKRILQHLPATELIVAVRNSEAARDAVAQLRIPHAASPAATYVSIGSGAAVLLRRIEMTAPQLITAADQTLYQAKYQGRDWMVCVQAEFG